MERVIELEESPAADWVRLGELEMARTNTPGAIRAFEQANGVKVPHRITGRRPGDIAAAWDDTRLARQLLGNHQMGLTMLGPVKDNKVFEEILYH